MATKDRDNGTRDAAGADRGQPGGGRGGGKSSGSSGKTETYRDPEGGQVTSYGAPIHTDQYGNRIAESPEKFAGTKQRVTDVNAASRDYNDRGFLEKVLDVFGGPAFNENPPDVNDPNTFWDGTYHTSTDVPGTIGMVAGMAGMIPGVGAAAGLLASQAGKMAGIPEVYHDPAPAGTREKYGMEPEGGWSPAAGGTNTGAPKGLVRDSTGGKSTGSTGAPTAGLVRQPVAPPASPQPTTEAAAPYQQQRTDYGFPTPTEKFGGSALSYYYDPLTGQLHPRAA